MLIVSIRWRTATLVYGDDPYNSEVPSPDAEGDFLDISTGGSSSEWSDPDWVDIDEIDVPDQKLRQLVIDAVNGEGESEDFDDDLYELGFTSDAKYSIVTSDGTGSVEITVVD
jgi:hypothetical protein